VNGGHSGVEHWGGRARQERSATWSVAWFSLTARAPLSKRTSAGIGPAEGDWVVFITGSDGHEAEFTVDRLDDRDGDADALAGAVADGLSRVLREAHIFLGHYDRHTGRLDPSR
jgi:hypothetical protein